MPSQYNNYGSYSSSYTSSETPRYVTLLPQPLIRDSDYMDGYSEADEENSKPRIPPPHATYTSTYQTTIQGSPGHSPKIDSSERAALSVYQHASARAPYETGIPASSPYPYAPTHHSASAGPPYAPSYARRVLFGEQLRHVSIIY
jgi:hypothetical protein